MLRKVAGGEAEAAVALPNGNTVANQTIGRILGRTLRMENMAKKGGKFKRVNR